MSGPSRHMTSLHNAPNGTDSRAFVIAKCSTVLNKAVSDLAWHVGFICLQRDHSFLLFVMCLSITESCIGNGASSNGQTKMAEGAVSGVVIICNGQMCLFSVAIFRNITPALISNPPPHQLPRRFIYLPFWWRTGITFGTVNCVHEQRRCNVAQCSVGQWQFFLLGKIYHTDSI